MSSLIFIGMLILHRYVCFPCCIPYLTESIPVLLCDPESDICIQHGNSGSLSCSLTLAAFGYREEPWDQCMRNLSICFCSSLPCLVLAVAVSLYPRQEFLGHCSQCLPNFGNTIWYSFQIQLWNHLLTLLVTGASSHTTNEFLCLS